MNSRQLHSRLWESRDRLTLETHLSPTTKQCIYTGAVLQYQNTQVDPGKISRSAGAAKCSGASSPLLLMERGDKQAHVFSPACSIP